MKTYKRLMVGLILVLVIIFLYGCGNKTEVRYITPTGHAVAQPSSLSTSVQVSVTDDDSGNDEYVLDDYTTVVEPAYERDEKGSYNTQDASVEEVLPKICSINNVILGYVGCYYDESRTSVTVTLKNSGRGEIHEMWFYIVVADKTAYAKSGGFESGFINDYKLPLFNWIQKHGRIQRILITPVVKEGNEKYACNNRQLLLLPKVNCREMVS